jgi:putative flippase GtrA
MIAPVRSTIAAQMLKFGVAGMTGFAIDAGLLLALTGPLGWSPYLARVASFAVALVATWLINRAWTFRSRVADTRGVGAEFLSYGAVQLVGGAANYGVYALVLALAGAAPLSLLLAVAAGSGVGMVINFLGARHLVFRQP